MPKPFSRRKFLRGAAGGGAALAAAASLPAEGEDPSAGPTGPLWTAPGDGGSRLPPARIHVGRPKNAGSSPIHAASGATPNRIAADNGKSVANRCVLASKP